MKGALEDLEFGRRAVFTHATEPCTPVVVHVPHASTAVPDSVRPQFVLSDAALADEQRLLVDHFTDELFFLPTDLAATVRFPVSRFVVDPERFEQDDLEPMSGRGMGAVYVKTTTGAPLRRPLEQAERSALLEAYYRPHHRRLTEAVSKALGAHRGCLLIDAHSFSPAPLACDRDHSPDRPDICLGTDACHTPPWLLGAATSSCRSEGWSVDINRPFAGTMVPTDCLHQNPRVWSLMIEVNRRLYLDEPTSQRSAGFERCRDGLNRVLRHLCAAASAELARIE